PSQHTRRMRIIRRAQNVKFRSLSRCRNPPDQRPAAKRTQSRGGQQRANEGSSLQRHWASYSVAIVARPRRRGDRVSNCVVGSGGSWLPCSTIAEHSVEGCDHFSHDGDDDDLGFFVGGVEASVKGLEGGTVTACAEGGHVEDVTDRHPTTIDAAVSLELAAVE